MKTILLVVALLLTGCVARSDDGSPRQREVPREQQPHYMDNVVRVDGPKDPYRMYRFENDEVICYSHNENSLACHWKLNEK